MSEKKLLRIAVCDDERQIAEEIAEMVKGLSCCAECRVFTGSEELLAASSSRDGGFDAILLDIEWDGMERGIETARKLFYLSPGTSIVYVTGYTQKYVQEVFLSEANLKGFLTKPVNPETLERSLKLIYERKQKSENKVFAFTENRTKQMVRFEDICYLESKGHRINIYTIDGQHECYGKLKEISEQFPEGFIQCHKSYLVNMACIDRLLTKERFFVLNNAAGTRIPISRLSYPAAREVFFNYRMKCFGEDG